MAPSVRCISAFASMPYDPLDRHSCESRNPGAAITGLGAPGFRLALRAFGMTGLDFKHHARVDLDPRLRGERGPRVRFQT